MVLTATGRNAATGVSDPFQGKWLTLSNTTLGALLASVNTSIILIALPDIFRGLRLDPLAPANTSYFLWMLMGYMLMTAVLVVSLGRLGDMFGRVKMYTLGFAVFAFFSILLSVDWMTGVPGALWLIIMRIFQGVGGALLFANSGAILTDAFPPHQRGLALGINQVTGNGGAFLGLILGGVLGPINWRLVFLVSAVIGVIGTVWAYFNLHEKGQRIPARIDWWGNLTFAVGLVLLLVGITYSILPYGGHPMGWASPKVLTAVVAGVVILVLFCWVETNVPDPMFRMPLFRIRAFSAGNLASLLSSLGRGGMMFILIIGLAAHLPTALYAGLTAHGVSAATASAVSQLPPTGAMFAAFLGYNPMQTLLGTTTLAHLPHATAAYLTGRSFFPLLISAPFMDGMRKAFTFAAIACVVAAIASWLRGGKYHHTEPEA